MRQLTDQDLKEFGETLVRVETATQDGVKMELLVSNETAKHYIRVNGSVEGPGGTIGMNRYYELEETDAKSWKELAGQEVAAFLRQPAT